MRPLRNLLIVAAVAFAAYHYQDRIGQATLYVKGLFAPAPCSQPIKYSIGSYSDAFGMSEGRFLEDVAFSGSLWSKAENKPLFEYDQSGKISADDVRVNLIYDYRQRATVKLQSLGLSIKDDLSSYDALKAKYDSLSVSYKDRQAQIAALTAQFDADKKSYEDAVSYWNARGGAPKDQYDRLQIAKDTLLSEANTINQEIASANDLVDSINSAATVLNRISSALDLNVQTYNAIGSSTGAEFDEGEYVEDSTGKHIDIYQFTDEGMLKRVLAHELGHALGMNHVGDPKAIMYRLNQSTNGQPTAADLAELRRVCKG